MLSYPEILHYFYSRPYARGDIKTGEFQATEAPISTHAPTRGATAVILMALSILPISTHAPTRGATAIIHKTLAAFCGKLPKKHTISGADCRTIGNSQRKCVCFTGIFCANLPHYSAAEGSALKNQRTSRFYKRTPSHCFDPVFI